MTLEKSYILALECATRTGGVALMNEEFLAGSLCLTTRELYSQRLLPGVDWLMQRCGVAPEAIGAVSISLGPGSFTGLRIGLSAAKSLAWAWGVPLIGVPTLEALAVRATAGAGSEGREVCVMLDARQSLCYAAIYRVQETEGRFLIETIEAPMAVPVSEVCDRVTMPMLFAGDAVLKHVEFIRERLGDSFILPPPHRRLPGPEEVAILGMQGWQSGLHSDVFELEPIYVRESYGDL